MGGRRSRGLAGRAIFLMVVMFKNIIRDSIWSIGSIDKIEFFGEIDVDVVFFIQMSNVSIADRSLSMLLFRKTLHPHVSGLPVLLFFWCACLSLSPLDRLPTFSRSSVFYCEKNNRKFVRNDRPFALPSCPAGIKSVVSKLMSPVQFPVAQVELFSMSSSCSKTTKTRTESSFENWPFKSASPYVV